MRVIVVPLICLFVLFVSLLSHGEQEEPTAMFRADLGRTGHFKTAGITKPPTLLWKFYMGERGEGYSTPVIAKGIVYCGSKDGHLYAVNSVNGKEQWRIDTEDKKFGLDAEFEGISAVIADGVFYSRDEGGYLFALR